MAQEGAAKRFVVDTMLGKLAKWLRILGFDTRYEALQSEDQLEAHRSQGYLLITRREKLVNEANVLFLKANAPLEQLREVVTRVPVTPQEVHLLQRCSLCNEQLLPTTRDEVFDEVPHYIFRTHTIFHRCPRCRKIYWPGSHPGRMRRCLERALGWQVTELMVRNEQ
jgi:hypothetical protein